MALVKLESFEFVWEAELIRSLLESEGIQAFVFDAEHIRVNWALSNALGGVRVMVNQIDLSQAQTIMTNWRDGQYSEYLESNELLISEEMTGIPDERTDNTWQIKNCPQCSSEDLTPIYNSIFTFLFIGPAPGKTIGMKCKSCNHRHLYKQTK